MAWLGARGRIDLADLTRRLDALPAYARPVFIRIAESLEVTATFKHKRAEMAAQGYDPAAIQDALYVYSRAEGTYVHLDGERFAAIQSGLTRL
jgi:fatty-acyl-CoA synthase